MKQALCGALILCGISAAHADESLISLLKNYYAGPFNFDGSVVRQYPTNAVVDNATSKSILIPRPQLNQNYFMTWGSEEAGTHKVLTLTESMVGTRPGDEITIRTSTFDGFHLRSSSKCFGHVGEKQQDFKCVTATQPSCRDLLSKYNEEAVVVEKPKPAEGAVVAPEVGVGKESPLLSTYESLAKVFEGTSPSQTRNKSKIAAQDMERIKEHLKMQTGKRGIASQSLVAELSQNFSASLDGLRAMNAALEICQQASGDFESVKK